MNTTLTSIPATPAEVASAVLDAIAAQPGHFSMGDWAYLPDATTTLSPQGELSCGTTLCVAGWAALVTGWTIHQIPEGGGALLLVHEHGEDLVTLYAEKDDVRQLIPHVAQEALGLTDDDTFWWDTEEEAITRLREIAGS